MLRCLSALFLLGLIGCGGDDAIRAWTGTVDTTASGAVVVRNPAQGLWEEGEGWTVQEELRIGSAMSEGPDLFGSVTGMVPDSAGRIHVLDRQAKELRTFGPDGRHVRTVGREGGGPGEFHDPIGLALGRAGDRLYVVDAGNARYAVFAASGEQVANYPRQVGGYSLPWNGGFDREGTFNEKIYGPMVLRMDSAFVPVDTARFPGFEAQALTLTMESGSISATVPFAPDQVERWDPRGYLWTAHTGDYTLTQMGLDGDTLRIIHGPPTPRLPVTAEDRDEAFERLEWFRRQGGRVDPGSFPAEKPPISTFHIADDGHLWVALTSPRDQEGVRYHILDPEGRFLGTVDAPESLGSAPVFLGRAVYSVARDSLGVQYIVRSALTDAGR